MLSASALFEKGVKLFTIDYFVLDAKNSSAKKLWSLQCFESAEFLVCNVFHQFWCTAIMNYLLIYGSFLVDFAVQKAASGHHYSAGHLTGS